MEMTRIETFTEAAFALAVTLLVISIGTVPSSFAELMDAARSIPTFFLSLALLFMFWHAHWVWSRRYGLDDLATVMLSFLLVFVVLCYVYPLRYIASLFVHFFSGGRLAPQAHHLTLPQLYDIFAVYGLGFVAMCLIIAGLYLWAWRQRQRLGLDGLERYTTRAEIGSWSIVAAIGVVSILVALLTPPSRAAWPGMVYMVLAVVMPIYGIATGRRQKKLALAAGRSP
jgi:hypothetical protein